MKRSMILFVAIVALLSCRESEKVWDDPIIGNTQFDYISVKKVVITKEETTLYMHIDYPASGTFTFGKKTFISAWNKQYLIRGCDKFELGDYVHTDPDTWSMDFTLTFEPLPLSTKVFDVIEGFFDNAYNLFNVRQRGVKLPVAKVPSEYRARYSEKDKWPEMKYSEEPITIHFKTLNFKSGMRPRLEISYFDVMDPMSHGKHDRVILNASGNYDYTTKIYYPQQLSVALPPAQPGFASFIYPVMAPGEELTILIDMNVDPDSIHDCFVGLKGYMAKTSMQDQKYMNNLMYCSDDSETSLALWTTKNAKTVSDIIAGHDSVMKSFKAYNDKVGYSDREARHFFDYELRYFGLIAEYQDSLFRSQEFLDYILRTRPACFFGDDIIPNLEYGFVSHLFADTDVEGIGPDMCRYFYGLEQSGGGMQQVEKPYIGDPYLSNLYDRVSGNIAEQMRKNMQRAFNANVHYLDMGTVAPQDILRALVDRYKGKTIVIDMSETWCGWCMKGHQEMAPMKEDVKYKDVVFLNIASPSSPFDEWIQYTNSVSGIHFYLTEEQNRHLSKQVWGTESVPKYAIYDKNGKLSYKQVGWGGLEKIQTEIDKALEK